MKSIPEKTKTPYVYFLNKQKILSNEIPYYLKWLKYYLDFCEEYSHPISSHSDARPFRQPCSAPYTYDYFATID